MTVPSFLDYFGGLSDYLSEIVSMLVGGAVALSITYFRRRGARRRFDAGELREEVIVVANILEEVDGVMFLKPRTLQSAQSLLSAFPTSVLVDAILAATKKCHTRTDDGPFIILPDTKMHSTFMKRVVDLVSEVYPEGHLLRMFERPVFKEEAYVAVTFSSDGPHRKVRIDTISRDSLRRFAEPGFAETVQHIPEEGSHADLGLIFTHLAKVYEDPGTPYTRRVSFAFRIWAPEAPSDTP